MIKIFCLVLIFSFVVLNPVYACLNSYVEELNVNENHGFDLEDINLVIARLNTARSSQEMNDDAVLLIRAGKYQLAIQLLEKIEKSNPNLPKTASNLGMAYELIGRP